LWGSQITKGGEGESRGARFHYDCGKRPHDGGKNLAVKKKKNKKREVHVRATLKKKTPQRGRQLGERKIEKGDG